MTEARLVTREQLAAALVAELHDLLRVPVTTEAGLRLVAHYIEDCETWVREHKDAIFAALPAAAPAEGLREALLRLVNVAALHDHEGYGGELMAAVLQARAALARHESAGSE